MAYVWKNSSSRTHPSSHHQCRLALERAALKQGFRPCHSPSSLPLFSTLPLLNESLLQGHLGTLPLAPIFTLPGISQAASQIFFFFQPPFSFNSFIDFSSCLLAFRNHLHLPLHILTYLFLSLGRLSKASNNENTNKFPFLAWHLLELLLSLISSFGLIFRQNKCECNFVLTDGIKPSLPIRNHVG